MGSGGGSPPWSLAVSGQTGGRIIPGTHYGLTTSGTGTTEALIGGALASVGDVFDYRTTKVSNLGGAIGAPGGGTSQPGLPGFDVNFNAGALTEPANGMMARFSAGSILRSMAGTGGGWGAKGGDQYQTLSGSGLTSVSSITVGGAGGKAVNTNGFSVTWLGGQDRAYGVVG